MMKKYEIPTHATGVRGILTVVDDRQLFEIKRVFWITDIDETAKRGQHAHKVGQQFIIAMSGRVKITSTTPDGKKQVKWLTSPFEGLWVPAKHWLDIDFLPGGGSLLVLASNYYTEKDYIRDFKAFKKVKP